jgi:hypothetical protein
VRRLRDRLVAAMGIRHPDPAEYGLHVGLGYLLRFLSAEQERSCGAC